MKKSYLPPLHAAIAAVYILVIVQGITVLTQQPIFKEGFLVPVTMLTLLVISAAIMLYLFAAEPVKLYLDNKKEEAVKVFFQTLGWFVGFSAVVIAILVYKS